ncbi:hypothetical protein GH740_02575 [Microbacterium sp. SYP-A9085]|uniref:hypothetical protein n=1 Tax=Microbacterium sp. SYP-A9085 TaxID=2664454 RepID=UPI00129A2784|nr:hypothetical protein [Microbacterium sp. SYP-A9085]MRH28198.1 hypothetical protein [Microbacterium sp. SYP-A9085]
MLFATRRAARCAGQLVALLAVTAMLGGTLAVSAVLAERFVDDGTARLVAHADPADRSIVVDAPADSHARRAVDTAVARSFRGTAVTVVRTLQATATADTVIGSVLLLTDDGIADHAVLLAGAWPSDDAEIAVAAPAAARSGIAVGDALTVGGTRVVVTGVWQATDAAATAWAGVPAVASGRQGGAVGPFVAEESLVTRTGARARWTVSAADRVTAADISGYRAGIVRLQAALDDIEGLGGRITGGWDATLTRAASAAAVARGMLGVPLALVVAVGLLALGVLGHAGGRRRAGDILVLRARGVSRTAVVTETAGIAGAVVLAAAVSASGAALAVGADLGAALGIPGIVAVVAAVLVTTVMAAGSLATPRPRGDVGRRALAGIAGALALTVVLAVVAVAQLLTSGLLRDAQADAAAAAAPALTLIAAALASALLAGPCAMITERAVSRGRSLSPTLALRRVARQSAVVVAGVLSLSLAAGGLAFALSATARTAAIVEADVRHAVGADVRAVYDRSPIVDAGHPAVSAAAVPGIHAAAAFVSPATAGDVPATLVGLAAPRLGAGADVSASELGPALPLALDGAVDLTVAAAMAQAGGWPGGMLTVSAWLVDRDGAARTQEVGVARVDGKPHRLRADVPAGLSLAAVEVSAASAPGTVGVQVAVRGISTPLSLTVDPPSGRARGLTVTGLTEEAPVVVTRSLAERLALTPGASVSVGLGTLAQPLAGRVVAVRDWLPGIGTVPGVAVDLDVLVARALQAGGSVPAAGELWADTTDIPVAAAVLRAVAEQPVRVLTADAVGTAAVIGPVLGLAAAGAGVVAVLALVAFAAVTVGVVGARRDEAVPLRAFGFTAARMRVTAVLELGGAGAFAVVCGVAAGLAVAVWLGPALTAAAAVGGVS